MPKAIRRGAMERALGRLKAGGQLEAGDAEVLDGFVKTWDGAAGWKPGGMVDSWLARRLGWVE